MKKKALLVTLFSSLFALSLCPSATLASEPLGIIKKENAVIDESDINEHLGSKEGDPFDVDGITYQNYTYGYALASDSIATTYYAGHHMGNDGNRVALSTEGKNYLADLVATSFKTSTGEKVPSSVDKSDLTSKMRVKYLEYLDKGFSLGIAWEDVKTWDGVVIDQDFAFGDGTFAFDAGRKQMSFLMYEPTSQEAHAVINEYASCWNDNKTLVYPLSESGTMNLTLPWESAPSDVDIQIFQKGFIYLNNGMAVAKTGYEYDASSKSFVPLASPYVPSEYGDIRDTLEYGSKKIFVYKYGSIIATLENNKYNYEYKAFRRYTSETEYTKVSAALIMENEQVGTDFDSACGYTDEEKAKLTPLIQKKYREYYDKDFMIGFRESSFSFKWNGINAQQFKIGDSTASPWEGTRTNIAALVWNEHNDTICLLKDDPLVLWNKSYAAFGSPLEDSFEADGNIYQNFENGLLVMVNGDIALSFLYEGSYEDYLAGKAAYPRPGVGDIGKEITNTYTDYSPLWIGLGVGGGVVLVLALGTVIILKKKKAKKE